MLAGLIVFFAPENVTNRFQFAFARIFRWPLSITRSVSLFAPVEQPLTDVVNPRELYKLRNHVVNLQEELRQEHQKTETLAGYRDRFAWQGVKFVLASVITASLDRLHSELIINRGLDDGLAKDQFVLGENSVIGTVTDVDARTARVRLFTDPSSKIAVKIGKLDVVRMMQGSGSNLAKVQMIKHKVKIGTDVIADKKPGYLPVPMIIGKVAQCKWNAQSPLLWDLTVKYACDIEQLNDVAVIIMNPKE
jgi:rod shape-determining protein MreC